MVVIYPVIELKDLIYAHRYGWLNALVNVTEGVTLRPEQELGYVFRHGETVRQYLVQKWGLPDNVLSKLKIMLDHGINSPSFNRFFGLSKTPQNLVYVYYRLAVNFGIAFDVPVRLYISTAIDMAIGEGTEVEIDDAVKNIVIEIANILKDRIRKKCNNIDFYTLDLKTRLNIKAEARKIVKSDPDIQNLLAKLSRVGAEETVKRLREMVEQAKDLDFKGLVPVIQGLNNDDISYCVKNTIEIMAQYSNNFMIAIGTGGRVISYEDIERIRFAIAEIKECARRNNVSVRIHLLGWSSPNRLQDPDIVKDIYSADSLTVRRRAVEGKVFILNGDLIRLIPVSQLSGHGFSCHCPACQNPILKTFILDPSGARRNDVRMAHNIYVLTQYLSEIIGRGNNSKPNY
jgi:hypothetical protein